MKNSLSMRLLQLLFALPLLSMLPEGALGQLAQLQNWSVDSNSNTYADPNLYLTDDGRSIQIRKPRNWNGGSNDYSAIYLDREGNPYSVSPDPISLKLSSYPRLILNNQLIPLGGSPSAFLIPASNDGAFGFCKVFFGEGLKENYGNGGFLETLIAKDSAYLGQIGSWVHLVKGVVDLNGYPVNAYGNYGLSPELSTGWLNPRWILQPSGARLIQARNSSNAPSGCDQYLIRITPEGKIDVRFKDGILIGRHSEAGLYFYDMPFEDGGAFGFHVIYVNGKIERYSMDPSNALSPQIVKTGEILGLPQSDPWNSIQWSQRTADGRFFLISSNDWTQQGRFIMIDSNFSSATVTYLPYIYPASYQPIMARNLPQKLVLEDFVMRRLHSYSGGYYSSTWQKYYGDPDADNDGIPDSSETGTGVYLNLADTGSAMSSSDTDNDGLSDFNEVAVYKTNPNLIDSDSDGYTDFFEVNSGYNPNSQSSKPAAAMQAVPAVELKIATQLGKQYRIEVSADLETWTDTGIQVQGTGNEVRDIFNRADQKARYWRAAEVSQ